MGRLCDPPGVSETCIPGCSGGEEWCENQPGSSGGRHCPWGPGHARDMVEQQLQSGNQNRYSEVIVDAAVWSKRLPRSIEAVYYTSAKWMDKATDVRDLIASHFHIPESRIPVLQFDASSGTAPFQFLKRRC